MLLLIQLKNHKKLNDVDRVKLQNILTIPEFEDYIAISGETKSGRYKHKKKSLDEDVTKFLRRSI